jgi:hypothetical protein
MHTTHIGTGRVAFLFGLALAGLGEDALPFNVCFVVGVDGLRDVHGVLENLAGAGVKHRQLGLLVVIQK